MSERRRLVAGLLALGAGAAWWRLRGRRASPRPAVVSALDDDTLLDRDTGAVRSIQTAELTLSESALERLWTPVNLERLARTYWRFLTRVTLGLIRVHYSERERSVVLLHEPLRMLTFLAPEYELGRDRGVVRWRIARGLLVSREGRDGRGHLQIEVHRYPGSDPEHARLHVAVEVANFYPSIASRVSRRVYNATQSRIHVIVTHGFLRSLARMDLAESRVGQLAEPR